MVLEYRRMKNSLHSNVWNLSAAHSIGIRHVSITAHWNRSRTRDTADSSDLGVNADCGQKLDVGGFLSLLQTEACETLIGVKSTGPHYLTT